MIELSREQADILVNNVSVSYEIVYLLNLESQIYIKQLYFNQEHFKISFLNTIKIKKGSPCYYNISFYSSNSIGDRYRSDRAGFYSVYNRKTDFKTICELYFSNNFQSIEFDGSNYKPIHKIKIKDQLTLVDGLRIIIDD